jgi:hypothetical protein
MPRRKKSEAAGDQGHNTGANQQEEPARVRTIQNASDEELEQLATAKDRIVALQLKRGSINDDIAKERKTLKANGWNLEGFDLACKLAAMDPAKRKAVDLTLHLSREALECPADLFAAAGMEPVREGTGAAQPSAATH